MTWVDDQHVGCTIGDICDHGWCKHTGKSTCDGCEHAECLQPIHLTRGHSAEVLS